MSRLRSFRTGLGALADRRRVERELDEELDGFLAESAAEKRQRGMSAELAWRAARVEMGSMNVVKHKVWNSRWEAMMDQMWADLRLGMRGLLKNPGFTLVAVLSLALGIGGNTAIFTLIHQVLLRELPVQKPEELAIFGLVDRICRGADHLDVEFGERAQPAQRQRAVQRGLPAHGRQQREAAGNDVTFLLDDLGDDLGRDRLDIGGVRKLRVGHDRRRIGIDQDDAVALFL